MEFHSVDVNLFFFYHLSIFLSSMLRCSVHAAAVHNVIELVFQRKGKETCCVQDPEDVMTGN